MSKIYYDFLFSCSAFLLLLISSSWTITGNAKPPSPAAQAAAIQQAVQAAAQNAQAKCYGKIHHEAYDFADCILVMANRAPANSPQRLGIEFFGWVGALNSARMGMLGAEDAAYTFMTRFEKTNRKVGLSKAQLCSTVPGDCVARLAQWQQMHAVQNRLGKNAPHLTSQSRVQHSHENE